MPARSNVAVKRHPAVYKNAARRWGVPEWLIVSAVVLLGFAGASFPLFGQTAPVQKATFLSKNDPLCFSQLPTGQKYEYQWRAFRWMEHDGEMYSGAIAYYAPDSGAFLWVAGIATTNRSSANAGHFACTAKFMDFLVLQDGEWAAFSAMNADIRVYHSRLRFRSINAGWDYVARHPNDMTWLSGQRVASVSLYKDLGFDFFRPESLRFDARPYSYPSLLSVTKVGAIWQLNVKGADPPNRAIVYLDSGFRLMKVIKDPAAVTSTSRSGTNSAARFPLAFVQEDCGPTDGIVVEFYFTARQSSGGKYAEPYLLIQLDLAPSKPGPQTYSIKQRSYGVQAVRCLTAGRCESAASGVVSLTKFATQQGGSGRYELHFQDGSVETGDFDATRHAGQPLLCG
jgi:hypothetical protein